MNAELLDSSSSILDSLSDSLIDQEDNSINQFEAVYSSSLDDVSTSSVQVETEQGSDESAVTPLDTSSVVTVIVDQREVIEELQRIEGYNISILYTLYIGLGLFFSVVIVKIILHFTKFN